ncbi:MAG: UDP-N-acetylglucosamine 1-carboxyvinyltransferase [Thermoanaerobaculia bacterium]|nr:UDP-N-acetylglucosamine 1-carboxyvinyltransferase [Thermoanaerobaculia bacterium]
MDRFRIHGPCRLSGSVEASGAKNAALPALAATLLAREPVILRRVPRVRDIATMRELLSRLGVESEEAENGLRFHPGGGDGSSEALYDLVKTMRASVLTLGPLTARRGRARVSLPGGCAIGVRPIDQHLAGLAALGAEVRLEHGYVETRAEGGLRGARFRFEMPTVTGTENVLMAAVLAEGDTVLENCAREPEIGNLIEVLETLGAKIDGRGTDTLRIQGVDALGGGDATIIPDRIEGGTYLLGAALTRGDVTLERCRPRDLEPLLEQLDSTGARVETGPDRVRVQTDGELRARDLQTAPHPGFPTDLQAQYTTLMTQARGRSRIRETVFENRFQHTAELMRMGAEIEVRGDTAEVDGPTPLTGARVMATDLRASACLVLAGLAAEGETLVQRIYHLDRGYEGFEEKLTALGCRVERTPGPPTP